MIGTNSSKTLPQIEEIEMESPGAVSYYRKSLRLTAELDVNGLQSTFDQAAINQTRTAVNSLVCTDGNSEISESMELDGKSATTLKILGES